MAKEKECYRDILENLLVFSAGKRLLNVSDIVRYLGVDRKTIMKLKPPFDFTTGVGYASVEKIARWLA